MGTIAVLNTDSDLTGKTLVTAEGDRTVTGNFSFQRSPGAPFTVQAGSGNVANLDADKLDGQHGSYYQNASNLNTGTVPTAQLGSGSATPLTFLRGDGTWAQPSGGISTLTPQSAFPVTSGNTFPYVYVGGGANSKQDSGLGVAASIGADSTWRLRFMIPPTLPAGTAKLRLLGLANATSGTAKITPQVANVAVGSSPSGATLSSETQLSLTWAAGDNDKYKELKQALATVPVASNVFVCDLVFNTASWTLAQISCWIPMIVWE